jgi:hypothetical protein
VEDSGRFRFVLHTGTKWEFLSQELSSGSDALLAPTAGLEPSWRLLQAESRGAGQLSFSRAAIDAQMRALRGRPSRPESGRARSTGLEAPCDHRGARNPSGGLTHRRQPQRHHPLIPLLEAIDGRRGRPHTHPTGGREPVLNPGRRDRRCLLHRFLSQAEESAGHSDQAPRQVLGNAAVPAGQGVLFESDHRYHPINEPARGFILQLAEPWPWRDDLKLFTTLHTPPPAV